MPKRSSEKEDSFVDEDFGDSKRSGRSDGLVTLFVELLEYRQEDVIGEIEEGSSRLNEFSWICESEGVSARIVDQAGETVPYLQQTSSVIPFVQREKKF